MQHRVENDNISCFVWIYDGKLSDQDKRFSISSIKMLDLLMVQD